MSNSNNENDVSFRGYNYNGGPYSGYGQPVSSYGNQYMSGGQVSGSYIEPFPYSNVSHIMSNTKHEAYLAMLSNVIGSAGRSTGQPYAQYAPYNNSSTIVVAVVLITSELATDSKDSKLQSAKTADFEGNKAAKHSAGLISGTVYLSEIHRGFVVISGVIKGNNL